MDGGVGDEEGEPYPLVTTTAKNVVGNLTRNLKKYVSEGGSRRKAILATSQELTPQKKKNLYKRANELGFTLVNIHDKTDIALRLYRRPEWCRELLGLTGNPPPLSVVPKSTRPSFEQPVVGRNETLAWLQGLSGDAVLSGQPGSGKTFLLQKLVLEEDFGLFVVSSARAEIAAGIRAQQPKTIIVDDAHVAEELVKDLIQIRADLGAIFTILATSWPGDASRVAELLSLPAAHIHQLELLTREQMVEVVRGAGIYGPRELIRVLVDQSEGRPGLASTLVHLCLIDGVQDVVRGDALGRTFVGAFERLVGKQVKQLLAAHAVGGNRGLPMSVVARALGIPILDAQQMLVKLAAGGVLEESGENLSVRPPSLRAVLLRDVFFSGATSLPFEVIMGLLNQAPSLPDAAESIFAAKARGASVPFSLLTNLVEQTNQWKPFAWSGPDAVT